MSQELDSERRRFLSATARALAAAPLGLAGWPGQSTEAATQLPPQMVLSSLDRTTQWLNSAPLTAAGLQGKVVLVDFWTYTCINWIRTAPYIRTWADKYREQGLVVVGVHTPEFPFEHDLDNVRRAVKDLRVDYPVVTDNDFAVWRAFQNQYWPALYFVDAQGKVRHHQFGEGEYERLERVIGRLLRDAGNRAAGPEQTPVEARGVEVAADWGSLRSPENYLGYARTLDFASPGGMRADVRYAYRIPNRLSLNQWALSGEWTLKEGAAALNGADGSIAYRFHARDLHLVMGAATPGRPVPVRVRIDGLPPGAAHGLDVDAQGNGTLSEPRLYQLVRQPGRIADRQFEITFPDAGVEAFAFTFG
ncbi:MAG: thioredoxin family protein [Cytophagales bacterium]|nr:thioredoxin family protein [Cytophagales bacterium]